jgi:OFA family oxalate/formate antiporter-like MFS transporter
MKVKNRWLIAASGVGIHLSIGSVYAWSIFSKPITLQMGWTLKDVQLTFSISILFLGLSAALLGRFVEKYGPRKAGTAAAIFFGLGIGGAGLAILAKNIYALYFCYGMLGGIGLGIGYIAPVSTLVKWFPDRRGLATGLAIMGFGFASLIAGPIIQKLIVTIGLSYTFFVLGAGYFAIILASSQYLSPPPAGWTPKGLQSCTVSAAKRVQDDLSQLNANEAIKTKRFYWLWLMLFINVTCGIAIISVASSMAQETAGMSAVQAAIMVGLMGLFNGAGRIAWASLSDYIGRPSTYTLFFALQMVMFFLLLKVPDPFIFQILIFLIMTCYGGGFSCIPAYIADLFGTKQLGAIHGYVLTAWAAAGLVGPILVAWTRQISGSYSGVIMIFLGLFLSAFILSLIIRLDIRRVSHTKHHEKADSLAEKTFDADVSEITATIDFVAKLAKDAGLDSGKISRLELAIEEVTSNICGHAYVEETAINKISYAYQKRSTYTVAIKNVADSFTVRMTDSGIAFNPLLVAPPDVSLPVEVRQTDGLGILLMRNMVDDVRYERTGDLNILTLVIHKT